MQAKKMEYGMARSTYPDSWFKMTNLAGCIPASSCSPTPAESESNIVDCAHRLARMGFVALAARPLRGWHTHNGHGAGVGAHE